MRVFGGLEKMAGSERSGIISIPFGTGITVDVAKFCREIRDLE